MFNRVRLGGNAVKHLHYLLSDQVGRRYVAKLCQFEELCSRLVAQLALVDKLMKRDLLLDRSNY